MNAGQPPAGEPEPASGEDGAHRYDPGQRQTAARIQHPRPHWLLMWGPHSRRYYAYPLFGAPPGTIVSASDPGRLVTRMRQAEAATAARPRVPPDAPAPEAVATRCRGGGGGRPGG